MKAIMLSVRPKYVSMILNKTKTIEVRKKFPKDYKGWVYIYCTKDNDKKHTLYRDNSNGQINFYIAEQWEVKEPCRLNGKVVARFYCDKVDMPFLKDITKESCLTLKELIDYLEGKPCNAIHISQLEIFDKPKELWQLSGIRPNGLTYMLEKAPQSYMFIEVE